MSNQPLLSIANEIVVFANSNLVSRCFGLVSTTDSFRKEKYIIINRYFIRTPLRLITDPRNHKIMITILFNFTMNWVQIRSFLLYFDFISIFRIKKKLCSNHLILEHFSIRTGSFPKHQKTLVFSKQISILILLVKRLSSMNTVLLTSIALCV